MKIQKTFDDHRLLSAVEFIRPKDVVADIGTDHAYLPIYLIQNGHCSKAVACDINQGPLNSAKKHIQEAGLDEQIDLCLTDGLHGVDKYCPDTIMIFGMGGELIARILDEAPFVLRKGIRLILQPMTHMEDTRRWLYSHGFEIIKEVMSEEAGKTYFTFCADYRGNSVNPDLMKIVLQTIGGAYAG